MKRSQQKQRKLRREQLRLGGDRDRRIRLLLDRRMIRDPGDIPPNAIPIDPTCSTKAKVLFPETCYRDVQFVCSDCSRSSVWTAESQQYYFEVMQAAPYKTAKRCYECRLKEVARKIQARKDAGHLPE